MNANKLTRVISALGVSLTCLLANDLAGAIIFFVLAAVNQFVPVVTPSRFWSVFFTALGIICGILMVPLFAMGSNLRGANSAFSFIYWLSYAYAMRGDEKSAEKKQDAGDGDNA